MNKNLLNEIKTQIIRAINGEKQEFEECWLDAETTDDYAELNITITRYFDFTGECINADVVITNLIIWGDENNDITTESDYQGLVKALEETNWIDAAYEYEQSENDRLFNLLAGATQPLNATV